jgi:hypothetical protein
MARAMLKPRAPVDKLGIRDVIWTEIRNRSLFTAPELIRNTKLKSRTVQSFIKALATAGYITPKSTLTCKQGHIVTLWHLVRDTGVEPPAITKAGRASTRGRTRDQLWRTMKMLTEFDAGDLALHASTETHPVTIRAASAYTYQMHHAGYLVCMRAWQRNSPSRFRLLPSKNTGPRSPRIVGAPTGAGFRIFDPNTGSHVDMGGTA